MPTNALVIDGTRRKIKVENGLGGHFSRAEPAHKFRHVVALTAFHKFSAVRLTSLRTGVTSLFS